MTRILFLAALFIGAIAIFWVAGLFVGTQLVGLCVTLLIAIVYGVGVFELWQFRRATHTLSDALANLLQPVDDLNHWLQGLDPSLRSIVKVRVEGTRAALPAPVLTPYLVGLLVMLGLLGTFVGMVDTLKGAVIALQGNSELEAIREGLAAPIEGLGLAFGTSVAGVAASAALGLLSAISRRERLQASQWLDYKIGEQLRAFSNHHQQILTFKAIQDQAKSLPSYIEGMVKLTDKIEHFASDVGKQLLDNQNQLQVETNRLYQQLNETICHSMEKGQIDTAERLNQSLQTSSDEYFSKLNNLADHSQKQLSDINDKQLTVLIEASTANNKVVLGLAEQSKQTQISSTQSMLESFEKTTEKWIEKQNQYVQKISDTIIAGLGELRADEQQRGRESVERLSDLQETLATHIGKLGIALEDPIGRLINTASDAPKIAAEVVEDLRQQVSRNIERDNDLLKERKSLLERLDGLSNTFTTSIEQQGKTIDEIVTRSSSALAETERRFSKGVESELVKLATVSDHLNANGAEVASLAESFNTAVGLFSESNTRLLNNLDRVETSLDQSSSRSDEQLAYYVAQAREIIDHNLLAHKEIIDAIELKLRQLHGVQDGAASRALEAK